MLLILVLHVLAPSYATSLPPSVELTLYEPGIAAVETELNQKVPEMEAELTNPDQVLSSSQSSDLYRMSDLHVTEVVLTRPQLQVVPGEGLRVSQGVSSLVVDGDYRVKALFFWMDGKLTLKTAFDLTVLVEAVPNEAGGLKPEVKSCQMSFHSFDINLHNFFFSAIASLMKGDIEGSVKKTLCEKATKATNGIDIMKELENPEATFGLNLISISGRLPEDTNETPMPEMVNSKDRMMCVMLSKDVVRTFSGKTSIDEHDAVEVAKKFVDILSRKNCDFQDTGNFVQICSSINVNNKLSSNNVKKESSNIQSIIM